MSNGSIVRSRIAAYGRTPKDLLRDPRISANAKVVYAMMDEVSGHEYLAVSRLASWLGKSEDTARRAIYELRDSGWVEIVEKFSEGRQLPNDYYCNAAPTPSRGSNGETPMGSTDATPRASTGATPNTETNETYESSDAYASVAAVADDTDEEGADDVEDGELFGAETIDPKAPARIAARDADREKNKRAQRLTKVYTTAVPLSKFPAILKVVRRAIDAGYDDERLETALSALAETERAVTVDALRIQLEALPKPKPPPAPCPCCTGAKEGSAFDLCAHCDEMHITRQSCDHGASGHERCDHAT